ncbi:MAG TPA: divalent-cation tolerance protein CutA [Thermoplasmata archaeon]|nr:divalent-cation tolerance protein CutA [Thermoplasmata archaeon]
MSPYPLEPPDARGPARVVVVAVPAGPVGDRLVRAALRRRLAACANVLPARSTYWWRGAVESADESVVLLKTVPKRVGALFRFLAARHPYEVPEILELDVPRVHPPYLAYLADTLDPSAPPPPLGGGRARAARPTRSGSRRGRGARAPARTRAPRRRR